MAWAAHDKAHVALTSSIKNYTVHVPKLPGATYTNSCHHSAWLRVLRGLSQATSGSVDERGIAEALMQAPVCDSAVIQRTIAPLLAVVSILQHAPAAPEERLNLPAGRLTVAARLIGLAQGCRMVLQRGVVESVSTVITTTASAMQQLHVCRAEVHAERRWRVPPATGQSDVWAQHATSPTAAVAFAGMRTDQQSQLAALHPNATTLLVDGELCRVLSDVADALADLAQDPAARELLSVAPLHSALISAEPHVKLLQEAAQDVRGLSATASRAAALHSFLTQAFCPSILAVKLTPIAGGGAKGAPGSPMAQSLHDDPVHAVHYFHQVFHESATGLRHEVQQLLSAHQKEQQYRSLLDSCEAELREVQQTLSQFPGRSGASAGGAAHTADNGSHEQALQQRLFTLQSAIARRVSLTAELQQAVAIAVSAVLQRVRELMATLGRRAALHAAVESRITGDYNAEKLCAAGTALDIDAVLAAEAVKESLLRSAETIGPLVCGALGEFSSLLTSLEPRESMGEVLRVPLSWYTGETRQQSQRPAPAGTAFFSGSLGGGLWGSSSIWGKPEASSSWLSATPAGLGSIWDDSGVGADTQVQADEPPTWPAQLNSIWSDVSAIFAIDGIFETAMHRIPEAALTPPAQSAWDTDGLTARSRSGRGGGRGRGRGRSHASAAAASPVARARNTLSVTNISVPPAAVQSLCDEASMCVAEVCMATVAAAATARLAQFIDAFAEPGTTDISSKYAAAGRTGLADGLPLDDGVDAQQESALLGALVRSENEAAGGASGAWLPDVQDDIPGGRHLEAFEFFNNELQGADMMLGGLSQTSSIGRESMSDGGDAAGRIDDHGLHHDTMAPSGLQDDMADMSGISAMQVRSDPMQLLMWSMPCTMRAGLALAGNALHHTVPCGHKPVRLVQAQVSRVEEDWADMHGDTGSNSGWMQPPGGKGETAIDTLALGNVTRCLTSMLLRSIPAELPHDRGSCTPGSRTRAAGRVPSAITCQDAARQYAEMCTTALDFVLYHLRAVLWMLSHHLGADLSTFCSASVSGAPLVAVLEEIGDVTAPSSMRVHVAVGRIQKAAADMFDAQQAVRQWRGKYDAASAMLLQHYRACVRVSDTHNPMAQAVSQVQQWADDALAHSQTILDTFCGGILSLEASRAGRSWAPRALLPRLCSGWRILIRAPP